MPFRPALRSALPVAAHPGSRRTRPFCPGEGWCRSPRRSRCRRPGQVHSPAERRQRRRSPALIGRPEQRLPALGGGRLRLLLLLLLLLRGRRRCPAPSLRRDPNAVPSAECRAPSSSRRRQRRPSAPCCRASDSARPGSRRFPCGRDGDRPSLLPAAPRRPRLPRGRNPAAASAAGKGERERPVPAHVLAACTPEKRTRNLFVGHLLGLRSGVGTLCETQRSKLRFP